jgi:hypothetical protein
MDCLCPGQSHSASNQLLLGLAPLQTPLHDNRGWNTVGVQHREEPLPQTLTVRLWLLSFHWMSVVTAFAPLSASPRQRRSVLLLKKGLEEKLISIVGGPPAAAGAKQGGNTALGLLHQCQTQQRHSNSHACATAFPDLHPGTAAKYATLPRRTVQMLTCWVNSLYAGAVGKGLPVPTADVFCKRVLVAQRVEPEVRHPSLS